MEILITGVVVWSLVHLVKALAPDLRAAVISKLGENPYKGIIALSIVLSLVLIVIGWRSTMPESVYLPPAWGGEANALLMIVSVFLFGAANYPTVIKRYIRHPMLTGMLAWSIGHLLANGDNRSLVLFAGLGVWALVEIVLISRREGAWEKPESPPMSTEIRGIVISAIVFAVLIFLHPYFAGVSPIPQ